MITFTVRSMVHRNHFDTKEQNWELESIPDNWDDLNDDERAEYLEIHGTCVSTESQQVGFDAETTEEVLSVFPVVSDNVQSLQESLEHSVRVLNAILNDVKSGSYNAEQAARDHDNLMMTEGLDFMSAIQAVAEGE